MMLCALENVKALLGISGTESDAMLEILIKTQSALICAYIGFNPSIREYTEIQAVNNNQLLQLNNRPIRSVQSVKAGGVKVDDFKVIPQYANIGMLYRGNGWSGPWYTRGMTYDPVSGAYDIEISYTAGWHLPGDAEYEEGAFDSLPYDITVACMAAVSERFNVISSGAVGIKSHSEGGISTTFEGSEGQGGGGLSKRVMAMLEPYRVIGVA